MAISTIPVWRVVRVARPDRKEGRGLKPRPSQTQGVPPEPTLNIIWVCNSVGKVVRDRYVFAGLRPSYEARELPEQANR